MKKSCIHSYVGVSIQDSTGNLLPCCKYDLNVAKKTLPNIYDVESLNNLHMLPPYRDVQNSIENNLNDSGCSRCWKLESSNLTSRRLESEKIYSNIKYEKYYIQDMEISLDFTCNMMCRICGPHASSKWVSARPKLIELNEEEFIDYNMPLINPLTYQEQFKKVINNTDLSKVKNIKILGGEPFYSKNIDWFIDKIYNEVELPNELALSIFTNGSIFPKDDLLKKLLKFASINIVFSIDATNDLASTTRWGVEWDIIEKNCQSWVKLREKNSKLMLQMNPTISILNVNNAQQILDFSSKYQIGFSFSFLDTPSFLSCLMIPTKLRQKWILPTKNQPYKNGIEKFNNTLLSDIIDENQFDKFLTYTDSLDKYQQRKFKDVNPEIYNLAKELKL